VSATLATGALRHALNVRKDDCYETPVEAISTLMRVEKLPRVFWEPACGPGAIVRPFRERGHTVIATDLVDYGLEDSTAGVDFLMETRAPAGAKLILTNPPFKLANEFARHGLHLCDTVILLLRLAYLEGEGRSDLIDNHLRRVWLGRERLPMMHRRGYDGPKIGNAAMPFAWFVFTRRPTGGLIRARRMSWRGA
jgi:hypothetical protein